MHELGLEAVARTYNESQFSAMLENWLALPDPQNHNGHYITTAPLELATFRSSDEPIRIEAIRPEALIDIKDALVKVNQTTAKFSNYTEDLSIIWRYTGLLKETVVTILLGTGRIMPNDPLRRLFYESAAYDFMRAGVGTGNIFVTGAWIPKCLEGADRIEAAKSAKNKIQETRERVFGQLAYSQLPT